MTTIKAKLLTHLQTCSVSSPCVVISSEDIRCLPCQYIKKLNIQNVASQLMKHFQSGSHKEKCCWSITRDHCNVSNPMNLFKTNIHKSIVHQSLSDHFNVIDSSNQPEGFQLSPNEIDNTEYSSKDEEEILINEKEVQTVQVETHESCVQASVLTEDVSCQSNDTFDQQLLDFLTDECGLKLKKDFVAADLVRCFKTLPLIKESVQNSIRRRNPQSWHNKEVKKFIIKTSLTHSFSSGLDFSIAIGGPLASSIKLACKPKVIIYPYLDVENIRAHFALFKEIVEKDLDLSISDIPVQASLDATAVTGRMQSRKSDVNDDERLLYGVKTHLPFQKTRITLNGSEGFKRTKSNISIDCLQSCPDLLENNLISRGTYYTTIILLPLVEKPKPYCTGMYCISKGSDAEILRSVHSKLQKVGMEFGIRIVVNPGDGDSTLRSLQWSLFSCKRTFAWLTELSIPLECLYSTNGSRPTFPLQDLLHDIKKGRNNIKRTETKCLILGLDVDRFVIININYWLQTVFHYHPAIMNQALFESYGSSYL